MKEVKRTICIPRKEGVDMGMVAFPPSSQLQRKSGAYCDGTWVIPETPGDAPSLVDFAKASRNTAQLIEWSSRRSFKTLSLEVDIEPCDGAPKSVSLVLRLRKAMPFGRIEVGVYDVALFL